MSRWFRFYDEAINDPKVLRLSDELYRAWTIMLCLTSKNEGCLPAADDIAVTLRMKTAKVCEWLTKLHAAGLLDKTSTGFQPHNWDGRQYKSDNSTDRVKRFRNGKRNVSETQNETLGETAPEQKQITEQKQSRADAPAAAPNLEDELKRELAETLGPSRSLDLSRVSVWLAKGYSTAMIVEVVKSVLARGTDVASLNYFDAALAQKHATRPELPSERAAASAKVDMDKVVAMFKQTGHWSKYAGPEPGMTGCRCPPEILAKHGLREDGRRLDS